MDSRSDENLVAACQRGERGAYEGLVERHYRDVFAVCLGTMGDVHEAEDIAQDAMVKGFLKMKKLRNSEQFGAWVVQIARNLCIDSFRRRKRIKASVAEQVRQRQQAGKRANENEDLHEAVRRLPKELRLPLVMYYFGNKNAKAIGEKLNISHSGVCSRIRAARKQLHKLLTQEVRNE